MDLNSKENGMELESATDSTDSEREATPTRVSRHAKYQESSTSLDVKSPVEPPKRAGRFFHRYFTTDDLSTNESNNKHLPSHLTSPVTSPSQLNPPEVFVCHFDKDYPPNTFHTSAPKHATMVPTDLLQVPNTKANANSTNSVISSKYMTPYDSENSLPTDHSFSSSQESVDLDYDMAITATRKKLLRSRRKSLSENNIAALCKPSSSNRRRSSCGSVTISHDAYQIKIANDVYNLSLPKPLKKKISQYNSYLAISISQNMVRNKHGGSTDV